MCLKIYLVHFPPFDLCLPAEEEEEEEERESQEKQQANELARQKETSLSVVAAVAQLSLAMTTFQL